MRIWGWAFFLVVAVSRPTFAQSTKVSEPSPPRGSVSFDTIGVILWGPSLSGEYNLGPASITATYRFVGLGLGTQFLYGVQHHVYVHPFHSQGLSLRGNLYQDAQTLSKAHVGLAMEYVRLAISDEDYLHLGVANFLVPGLHAGYRFRMNRWFLDPSLSANVALLLGTSQIRRSRNDPEDLYRHAPAPIYERHYVGGDVRLEIGRYF